MQAESGALAGSNEVRPRHAASSTRWQTSSDLGVVERAIRDREDHRRELQENIGDDRIIVTSRENR
jgi:hypothetical protein